MKWIVRVLLMNLQSNHFYQAEIVKVDRLHWIQITVSIMMIISFLRMIGKPFLLLGQISRNIQHYEQYQVPCRSSVSSVLVIFPQNRLRMSRLRLERRAVSW